MRSPIGAVTVLVVTVAVLLSAMAVAACVESGGGDASATFLAVCGLVVAGATIASISFGVLTFLESGYVLSKVDAAQDRLNEVEADVEARVLKRLDDAEELLSQSQKASRDVALTAIASVYDVVLAIGENGGVDEDLYRQVRLAEADVLLAAADVESVRRAAHILYKCDKERLSNLLAIRLRDDVKVGSDEKNLLHSELKGLLRRALSGKQ